MSTVFASSVYFGLFSTFAVYFLGLYIRKKTGISLMNPLMIAVVLMIALLCALGIPYSVYQQSAKLVSSLLTPATICLAVPLYEQLNLLKKHPLAITAGVISGVITAACGKVTQARWGGHGGQEGCDGRRQQSLPVSPV